MHDPGHNLFCFGQQVTGAGKQEQTFAVAHTTKKSINTTPSMHHKRTHLRSYKTKWKRNYNNRKQTNRCPSHGPRPCKNHKARLNTTQHNHVYYCAHTRTSTVAFASFFSNAAASPLTCAPFLSRTQTPSALAARLHLAFSVASREGTCSVTEYDRILCLNHECLCSRGVGHTPWRVW